MGNLDQIVPNLCNFISHDPLWGTIGRYLLHLNYQEILFGEKLAVCAQVGPRFCNLICRGLIQGFF